MLSPNTKFMNSRRALLEEALRINALMRKDETAWINFLHLSRHSLQKENDYINNLLNEKSGNERRSEVSHLTTQETKKRWECYQWLADLDTYLQFEQIADIKELQRCIKAAKRKLHSTKGMLEKFPEVLRQLNSISRKLTMLKIDFEFINKGKLLLPALKELHDKKISEQKAAIHSTQKMNDELRRIEKQNAKYYRASKMLFKDVEEKIESYRPKYENYRKSRIPAPKQYKLDFEDSTA